MGNTLRWEDLTIYRPLKKEELKNSYKNFSNIIAGNMLHFGFKAKGRMLIRRCGEILHVIHIDTRGSWMGMSDTFKIDVAITTVYDEECLVFNRGLTGAKSIEYIIPKLRNYYRLTRI